MDQFHLLHLLRQNYQLQLTSQVLMIFGLWLAKEEHSGEYRAVDADNVSVALLAKAVYNLQSPKPETPQLASPTKCLAGQEDENVPETVHNIQEEQSGES